MKIFEILFPFRFRKKNVENRSKDATEQAVKKIPLTEMSNELENLDIAKTKDTLEIHFDVETGILSLEGASYPENPIDFFEPIYRWIKRYTSEIGKTITVNVKINYLNTSSSKCIIDFFELLEEYHQERGVVKINWYYEEDDEDMLETGTELCEELKLTYKLIPY
jgi:hypothetical protein